MIRAERHIETEKEVCGEITVFLSLILTCICALMGGLFESARAAGSGWYMQMALNSSLDSLMSCYHREIWDKYRIFVLECADKERLAAEMEPQMETYLAAAPFYPVSGGKVQIEAMDAITGHKGDFFAKEVTDYMKVGVWTLESEESELPEMEKRMTEARAVHGIAEGYQENGRKVLRLEESIEAIGACLQKQEKHLEEMEAAVRQADGSSFFQLAESLEKILKAKPGRSGTPIIEILATLVSLATPLINCRDRSRGRRKPSRIWKKAPGAWYRRRCGGIVRIWMRMERAARR